MAHNKMSVEQLRVEALARKGRTCPICGMRYLWTGPACSTTCKNELINRPAKVTSVQA